MDENSIIAELNKEGILEKPYILIPATKRTPKVILDPENGKFYFAGRSYPSNAKSFYYPLLRKINEYIKNPKEQTTLSFFLEYIDSSTTQLILTIINKFKEILDKGKKLEIEWRYMEDDEDIREMGTSFQESSAIPFKFIEDTSYEE